jgi:hypothetical protein
VWENKESGRRELQALTGQERLLLSSRCHNQIAFLALAVLSKQPKFSHIPGEKEVPQARAPRNRLRRVASAAPGRG